MRAVRELTTRVPYRFSISDMSFISASTAAIFSADEGWGRPNPRNDILWTVVLVGTQWWWCWQRREGKGEVCTNGQ